jgi:hypothetical protein
MCYVYFRPFKDTAVMVSEKYTGYVPADIIPEEAGPVAGCEHPDKVVSCRKMEKTAQSMPARSLFIPKLGVAGFFNAVIDLPCRSNSKTCSFCVSICGEQLNVIFENCNRLQDKQRSC